MIRRALAIVTGWFLAFSALAGGDLSDDGISSDSLGNHWTVIASLGYGEYQHMYQSDGQTAIGRLALGAEMLAMNHATFGLEFGAQSGNQMRIAIPQPFNYVTQSTVKPMVDLLVTAHVNPLSESLLFTQLKGGVVYRYWKMESDWMRSKSELAGEVQAGIGYPITELTNLNILYQGIFGGNAKVHFNPLLETGYVANIPVQHGVLVGISMIV